LYGFVVIWQPGEESTWGRGLRHHIIFIIVIIIFNSRTSLPEGSYLPIGSQGSLGLWQLGERREDVFKDESAVLLVAREDLRDTNA
jgi:hypothetical protein